MLGHVPSPWSQHENGSLFNRRNLRAQQAMSVLVHIPPEDHKAIHTCHLPSKKLVVPCWAVPIVKVCLNPIHILGQEDVIKNPRLLPVEGTG